MRRVAAGAVLLLVSVAPLPAARAADSDPVAEATARAVEFWVGTPCDGTVTVIGSPAGEAPPAGENDGEAGHGVRAAMWATWMTPSGANQFTTPPAVFSDCVIHVNLAVWQSWRADDREFAAFCKEMLHEYGHFEGYPDVGAIPDTIEYEQPVLAHVPLCERYRLIYGHELYTAANPRGRPLPKHSSHRRLGGEAHQGPTIAIAGRLPIYNLGMAAKPSGYPKGPWTPEEIARDERVNQARALRDRENTPRERLEETLRLSRFMSELRQGMPGDVRAR